MSSFLIEDDQFVQSGLCLLDTFDEFIVIADIQFLDETATVKEYKQWERQDLHNAIPLSEPNRSPQIIPHSNINDVASFKWLTGSVVQNIKDDDDLPDVEMEDFTYPIIGGFKGFNFRELLTRLWNTEGNLYDYQATVKDYYEKNLTEIAKSKTTNVASVYPRR